ncbi:hypothetical protein PsorP6_001066 [Peronosclerospora sorghi]|uniref:Uncharacterized protein n=1 Tax=Peronosclerospora sorghi TaxID=230839 RepID=A0ACC0WVY4_9STRA|nr:hypothetical protein PsorP6_001066 [Peronosclerospora sorghi]
MDGQVEKGSFVTCMEFSLDYILSSRMCVLFLPNVVEYDVPETHSVKNYVQMLIYEEGSQEIKTG